MATGTHRAAAAIDAVDVTAYKIPTATEQESDGTLVWDSTSVVVVEVHAEGETGLGYTYCHPAAAQVIESKLASVVEQADALMPQWTWAQMQVEARQLGHAGIAAMAISAVDIGLEPLSSEDLQGLAEVRRRAPAGLSIAAGEYGWNLTYFQQMLDAGAVHILQADVTRCGGITNLLRVDALCKARNLPFSAHCAPAVSAHACCSMETVVHIEYFFDHYRIESMLFDGTLDPSHGRLTPDRSRPGHGLELKRDGAERYRVSTGGDS